MDLEQATESLRRHPFFAFWEPDTLHALLERCNPRTYSVGEALWSAGESGDRAFVLVSGRVERTRYLRPDGHRFEQYGEPGAMMSLSSLVHPWPHASTGTPTEQTVVFELTRDTFWEMFEAEHPAAYHIVDAIAEKLVEELRDTNRRLHQVFGQPAETLLLLRRRMRETEAGE